MNQNNSQTYIIKINLNDILQNDIHNIIHQFINDITITNNIDDSNIIFMNKDEYSNYIFENSGSILKNHKTNDNCIICQNNLKYTHKLFKLNMCNHIYHHKCIKKWYKECSKDINNIHQCPLCRSTNEIICEI